MSGGAKAVSTGRSKFMKGVEGFWNEFERGAANEPSSNSSTTEEGKVTARGM